MLMTFVFGATRSAIFADAQHHVRCSTRCPTGSIASAFDVDRDVLAGKQLLQLLLERADRLLDDDVVLLALVGAPDNQADRARRLAVDQHLARLDDGGVGDRRDW